MSVPLIGNWPPSRGPNPHTHGVRLIYQDLYREDVHFQESEISEAERETIEGLLSGEVPDQTPEPDPEEVEPDPIPRSRPMLVGKWRVLYQVADVANLTIHQADRLLHGNKVEGKEVVDQFDTWLGHAPRTLTVRISYPLTIGVKLVIPPLIRQLERCRACREAIGVGDDQPGQDFQAGFPYLSIGCFLWLVAKEYERIYADHEAYGVWGHEIGDLVFESIEIAEDGVVVLGIGS